MRLRRSSPARPGYSRRRCGRGFSYHDDTGTRITEAAELERLRSLAIPPAWRDVWICSDRRGHLQAVGTDSAGRRQYLYHPVWREQRDAAKFDDVLALAERLPRLRRRVDRDLAGRGTGQDRVLAAAVRLLELGCFRIGGEEYAVGEEASYGLATLLREHVTVHRDGSMTFCYPAKGGATRRLDVSDPGAAAVLRSLLRRREPGAELLAYRQDGQWHDVRSSDINSYLKQATGCPVSAKGFRTWHATVLAAVSLAGCGASSVTARRRAVREVFREVADLLGNTPAVAKASYVDPRVVDLFWEGVTVAGTLDRLGGDATPSRPSAYRAVERAVLRMLRDQD